MIFGLAIFLVFISLILLLGAPTLGIRILFFAKPVIDATWKIKFIGLNLQGFMSTLVPIIVVPYLIRNGRLNWASRSMRRAAAFLLISNILVSIGMVITYGEIFNGTEYLFRALNFYIAFFLIPSFIQSPEIFKKFILALLLAGVFPMCMGMYQLTTGQTWEIRVTSFGLLERNVGLYHDAFSFRYFGFQTIVAIFLMLSYFAPRKPLMKFLLLLYAFVCAIVVWKIYSKSAIVILISWFLIFAVLNKNKKATFGVLVICVTVLISNASVILNDLETLFIKEVGAYKGVTDLKYVLAGRPTLWVQYWNEYAHGDLTTLIFGVQKSGAGSHNDFLRAIYSGGIFLFVCYINFLYWGTKLLVGRLRVDRSPLSILGLMLLTMWLIDMLGMVPSLYPGYSWFVWGMIGLAIRGVPGLTGFNSSQKMVRDQYANIHNRLGVDTSKC